MTDGRYAKPRLWGRGFARSLWRAVASFNYLFGPEGASAYTLLSFVAVDGARSLTALLWEGAR
jgi:hypothetical protein